MGKATAEKKERNDRLVIKYMELRDNGDEAIVPILEKEFKIGHSAIYAILKRRGVSTRRTQR